VREEREMWNEPAAIPVVLKLMDQLIGKRFSPLWDITYSDSMKTVDPNGEPNYYIYLTSDTKLEHDLEQPDPDVFNWAADVWAVGRCPEFKSNWVRQRKQVARQFAWICRAPRGYPCYILVSKKRVVRAPVWPRRSPCRGWPSLPNGDGLN
jgi:hypothetical protein